MRNSPVLSAPRSKLLPDPVAWRTCNKSEALPWSWKYTSIKDVKEKCHLNILNRNSQDEPKVGAHKCRSLSCLKILHMNGHLS